MIKILKSAWLLLSILVGLLYIVSCFSAFIPAHLFSYNIILVIAFPYLFVLLFLLASAGFFIHKKTSLLLVLLLPFGWRNITHSFVFSNSNWQQQKDSNALVY